jgi:hypothetical protein
MADGRNSSRDEEIRLRALVRARLGQPLPLLVGFCAPAPRDSNGIPIGGPIEMDSWLASGPNGDIHRLKTESLAEFETRIWQSLPAAGFPSLVVMWPGERPVLQ